MMALLLQQGHAAEDATWRHLSFQAVNCAAERETATVLRAEQGPLLGR
jgi:hypothetical protein